MAAVLLLEGCSECELRVHMLYLYSKDVKYVREDVCTSRISDNDMESNITGYFELIFKTVTGREGLKYS